MVARISKQLSQLVALTLAQFSYPSSLLHPYTTILQYGWNHSHPQQTSVKFGTPITLENDRQYSIQAKHLINAYELYFHWLNTNRGGININGIYHPAELILINDDSQPLQVEWATRRLIQNYGVRFLLGPYSNDLSNISAGVVHELGGTMMSSGAEESFVFDGRPQVFGTSIPVRRWFETAIEMLAEMQVPPKRIGYVMEDQNPSMKIVCSALPQFAHANSMTIVGNATINPVVLRDFSDAVGSLRNASADVVFGCLSTDACHAFLDEAKVQDFNPQAFIFVGCVTDSDFMTRQGHMGRYIMGSSAWSQNAGNTSVLTNLSAGQFYDMYTHRFGVQPDGLSASAFSASAVLVNAIERTSSLDPKVVAGAVQASNVNTVYGQIRFDTSGQSHGKMLVVQRQDDGALRVIAPAWAKDVNLPATYPKPTWSVLECRKPVGNGSNLSLLSPWGYEPSTLACGVCAHGKAGYNETLNNTHLRMCRACPQGHSLWPVMSSWQCQACDTGRFWCGETWTRPTYLGGVPSEADVCKPAMGMVSYCWECPPGRYADELGLTMCKACQPGRYLNLAGRSWCDSCAAWDGNYPDAFSATPGREDCVPCPQGGLCEPDANFLRSSYVSADSYYLINVMDNSLDYPLGKLYKCVHGKGKACQSHNRCYGDESSGEMFMDGPLCGNCRPGYSKGEALELCSKCESVGMSWALAFSSQALLFVVTAWLALSQMFTDPRRMLATREVVLRQFLNYAHLSMAVFPVTSLTSIGEDVLRILGGFQYMSASRPTLSAAQGAECFLQEFVPSTQTYKAWVIAGLCMVPAWFAFDLLFFMCVWYVCKLSARPRPKRDHFVILVTLNLFVIQPRLTRLFLVPFQCKYIDKLRLLTNTSVLCDSLEILPWQLLGLVGLLAFSIGMPIALIGVLYFYKRRNELHSITCARMFGFFFYGLRPECYFMESINMIRKVVFEVVDHVPWMLPANQDEDAEKSITSLSLAFLCVVFLAMHLRWRPYDIREFGILDSIESAMLWALLVTCLTQYWNYASNTAWMFTTESKNMDSNMRVRDGLCSAVVLFFHARFFVFVLYGVFGRSIRSTQLYQRWYGGGTELEFQRNGLVIGTLSDAAKLSLAETVREIAWKCLGSNDFRYSHLNDTIRHVGVETFYQKDRECFEKSMPFVQRTLLSVLARVPDGLKGQLAESLQIQSFSNSCCENAPWRHDPYYKCDLRDVDHAINRTFSVEDLQTVVVRLAWQEHRLRRRRAWGSSGKFSLSHLLSSSSTLAATKSSSCEWDASSRVVSCRSDAERNEFSREYVGKSYVEELY